MSELFDTVMGFIPIIIIIIVFSKVSKDIKRANQKNSSSKSVPRSVPMSDAQLQAINEKNRKEMERVKRAAESNKIDFKPIHPSEEYDLSKSKPISVGHSNQKDALNIKTSAKGVNVGQSDFNTARLQLRKEMEDRSHDWLA